MPVGGNRLKDKLKAGEPCVNGWLAIPSAVSAEVMAQAGWDSLTVDLQHGVQDYQSMVACFQGMQGRPVTPMVRLQWNDTGLIGKVLDGGAQGLICPMVAGREDTESLVAACRYPPHGRRSNGPIRAAMYGTVAEYQKTAADQILCLPMIEMRQAVDDLDGILDVPGIDGVYVGPSDLSWAYGLAPGLDRQEPEMIAIFEKVVRATQQRGLVAGIHCASPGYAARMIGMGYRLVTIMSDSGLMLSAARGALQQFRSHVGTQAA